ncbi:MAG: hypothetical protein J7J89_05125 [Thermoplasmata archaeon]|nr:hypothetical protein [Thermoplasmata archaeon]
MKKQSLRTNLTSKVQNSAVVLHKPFPSGHITVDKRSRRLSQIPLSRPLFPSDNGTLTVIKLTSS